MDEQEYQEELKRLYEEAIKIGALGHALDILNRRKGLEDSVALTATQTIKK